MGDRIDRSPTLHNRSRQGSWLQRTPKMVAVGDKFPSVVAQSHEPSWPTAVKLTERLAGKKTIFVGLPGAFTPT